VPRHHNGLKTAALLGLLTGAVLAVGYWFGGSTGLVIATFLALAMNAATYLVRQDRVAGDAGCPVSEAEMPQLNAMVRDLANQAGQPMPRLYVSPTPQPNAFATAATRATPPSA
jgi:heat shock protein HtpX